MDMAVHGKADVNFLKSIFNKLLINFTWWVNRKDRFGKNVFEGGFLGLDNIGIFDRSAPLPTGGNLEQADGTAWMALFSQNMLEMASELSRSTIRAYEDMVVKFSEHFYFIAAAMNQPGPDGMWDEEDGFYYDLLRLPDGSCQKAQSAFTGRTSCLCVPSRSLKRNSGKKIPGQWPSYTGKSAQNAGTQEVYTPHRTRPFWCKQKGEFLLL